MIFVTGDTHIPLDIQKLNTGNFPQQRNLTRDDYVVVLGDFGLFWKNDKTYAYYKKWLEDKSFTLLWVDGNHENFDWINSLPVSNWKGGRVHQTSQNIIHLMRGEVYNIDGVSILAAGGAQSYDRAFRSEGVSWWRGELWNFQEQENCLNNIVNNRKIDYVFSHTCPTHLIGDMFGIDSNEAPDPTTKVLDAVLHEIDTNHLKAWCFGHWHVDKKFLKFRCLYNEILRLG